MHNIIMVRTMGWRWQSIVRPVFDTKPLVITIYDLDITITTETLNKDCFREGVIDNQTGVLLCY